MTRQHHNGSRDDGHGASTHGGGAPGKRTLTGQIQRKAIQCKDDPAKTEVAAVKSKELDAAQLQEKTDWPGVAARAKNRKREIDDVLGLTSDATARATLEGMKARWDGTPVSDASFDPIKGALDGKALRALIDADQADAAKLTGKPSANLREWVSKLATALAAFLKLRQMVTEEQTEFHRFDDAFVDAEVKTLLAGVPGGFRPADLKAMLAQETGDFTDKSIAGLDGKTAGITHTMQPNAGRVGISQLDNDAVTDARTLAASLGVKLPEGKGDKDPRKDPASSIKIAAGYLAYIGAQLVSGLPPGKPSDAGELRKLVMAAYNGGPFGLIAAAKELGGPYTWTQIAANPRALVHFAKPAEVKDYVKRVTERAP